jgi:hypothetical protein
MPSAEMAPGEAERARGRALTLALALRKPVVTRRGGARFSNAPVKLMRAGDRLDSAYGKILPGRGTVTSPYLGVFDIKP